MSQDAWEDLDCAGAWMWGVFPTEAYSAHPTAIFGTRGEADAWIAWQAERGDDGLNGCDYAVCPIEKLSGRVWNSTEDPPEAT